MSQSRIEKFNSNYKLLIGALCATFAAFVADELTNRITDHTLSNAIIVCGVTLSVYLLNAIVEGIVENVTFVRKWIAKDEFIEGYWTDLTFVEETGEILHGVIFKIFMHDGRFAVSGVGYSPTGSRVSTFNSTKAVYQDRVLFYEYQSFGPYTVSHVETGVIFLQFPVDAESYNGFYLDYTLTLNKKISGRKVTRAELSQFGKLRTVEDQRTFLMKQFKLYTASAEKGAMRLREVANE